VISRIGRYVRTARHYKLSQIVRRVALDCRRATVFKFPKVVQYVYGRCEPTWSSSDNPYPRRPTHFGSTELPPPEDGVKRAMTALRRNTFRLLNEERTLNLDRAWDAPEADRLWLYNLHYFDWAEVFVSAALWWPTLIEECATEVAHLIESWIRANAPGVGPGWHAYPLSRRLRNWAILATWFESRWDPATVRHMRLSWALQAQYLSGNVEWDIEGNHLVANAKALLVSGTSFKGPAASRWFDKAVALLMHCSSEQILDDGGHYERSPMYHHLVLEDLLEAAIIYAAATSRKAPWLARCRQMLECACWFTHVDGDVFQLQDSVLASTRPLSAMERMWSLINEGQVRDARMWQAILAPRDGVKQNASRDRGERWLSSSGYFAADDGEWRLLVDADCVQPPHLPAHAHAGIGTYELGVRSQRLIVDAGVGTYAPGRWRDYWRSSEAHNVTVVGNRDQSEMWDAFRVGRRAHMTARSCRRTAAGWHVVIAHDGYGRSRSTLGLVRHVLWFPTVGILIADELPVTPVGEVCSFVHVHPDVKVTRDDTDAVHLGAGGESVVVVCWSGNVVEEEGWYAPDFNIALRCPRLAFSAERNALDLIVYGLLRPAEMHRIRVANARNRLAIRVDSFEVEIPLSMRTEGL
jgi:uncharacterized heparinase superfamily protein